MLVAQPGAAGTAGLFWPDASKARSAGSFSGSRFGDRVETTALLLNVVGFCRQPEPSSDHERARMAEVADYDSGQESAEPVKHGAVTRDLE